MTNTTTESQIVGMLKRLRENSGLELSIDYNASRYTLYLMEQGKMLEQLGQYTTIKDHVN
ncbi:MAG: hypothetical protein ACRD8W_05195 [Nitrososphaeraceae archaeon]